MKLIAFTKMFPQAEADDLLRIAASAQLDGFDLCVRDEYRIHPGNVDRALPKLVESLRRHGISVPLVSGPGLWCEADEPDSRRMIDALAEAGVGLLKLGYVLHKPSQPGDYRRTVERFRDRLRAWVELAKPRGVRVCYHTHCDVPGLALGYHLGVNCAELRSLLEGFDPADVGAYIGTGNLIASGEPFALGVEMLRDHLAVVELQDLHLCRRAVGDEGEHARHWTTAGHGAVRWSEVFATLMRVGFDGPLTMHAEFEVPPGESFETLLRREGRYFRAKLSSALQTGMVM